MVSNFEEKEPIFAYAPALIAFLCMECLVIVQALLASENNFLTVTQMQKSGIDQGLPFIWHFAMWGDLLLISSLTAYLIGQHSANWTLHNLLISFVLGFASSAIMHWTYTFSGFPEAHVQNHQLTTAGIVHFIYMAIAFAILTQFLFFTKDTSPRELKIVSLLLVFHVFLGTHMVLGILSTFIPLQWYPEKPLQSIPGWTIMTTVSIGLVWRNLGLSGIVVLLKNLGRTVYGAILWLLNLRPESTEGYLQTLDYVCDFVGFGFFVSLFVSRWQELGISASIILLSVVAMNYYFSRLSVKQELEIGVKLFPPGRIPNTLQLNDRITITLQVVSFLALYMFLGWVTQYIVLASLCITVIACIDFSTRKLIGERMRKYLFDPQYALLQGERGYEDMQSRRSVIQWYLFELPSLRKEAGRVAGFAIAFMLATYGYFMHQELLQVIAYAILIGTILITEFINLRWRIERDRRLKLL